ncbi:MAG: immunoglobulin domain-containing protein, partial [Verrucomicrobiae bacterium]|nr:immunoglobulin domain-containing protein [Verrucomicrobiae bacterium]
MKRKSILAAGLWVLGLGSAMAADVTLGTATPPVGAGVRNLSFSANDATNTAHAFVASDYLAADHPQGLQMGQSFTTGANVDGYLLTSISVRQVSWASNWDYTGGNVTLRVFDSSGGFSPSVQLVSQTAAVGGEDDGVGATTGAVPTEPMWLTFTLDAPLALDPNKLYSFAFSTDGTATNDGFFMNLDGTSTDSYAGGSSISVDTTNSLWNGGGGSDRAFVAAMTVPSVPAIPVFEQQPQPEYYIGYVGDDVTLSATAIGDPEPGYQWEFSADGNEPWTELTGETSSVLNIPFAEYADNGFFRVVASNTNGSATSNPATLDLIYPNPVITQQPQSTVVLANGTATISVGAESGTGLGTLTYEWYKVDLENGDTLLFDGGNISGSETFELQISNVSAADEGEYYAYVYDDAGEADEGFPAFVVSENATLTIGANLASVGTATPAVA